MQLSLLFHQNPLLQVLNYILSVDSPKILQTIKGDLICLAHVEKKMVCYLISQIKEKNPLRLHFSPDILGSCHYKRTIVFTSPSNDNQHKGAEAKASVNQKQPPKQSSGKQIGGT